MLKRIELEKTDALKELTIRQVHEVGNKSTCITLSLDMCSVNLILSKFVTVLTSPRLVRARSKATLLVQLRRLMTQSQLSIAKIRLCCAPSNDKSKFRPPMKRWWGRSVHLRVEKLQFRHQSMVLIGRLTCRKCSWRMTVMSPNFASRSILCDWQNTQRQLRGRIKNFTAKWINWLKWVSMLVSSSVAMR